jgi:mono/diheme cytochrome c family protein
MGEDPQAPVAKAAALPPAEAKPAKVTAKKKLTGAELYAINCNRCHAERYATEFTSAQWKTLMMHMRVRANLPAAQAKLILKYLQEDSGN